ncbi:ras-related protein RGP1-like [Iris pallida]|uniref:Ras-related protein RGP1-like n=1 Tax=Iris pallida TaxID=29817 RepID=A0AAX6G960_IRIPA|nr:ras-related protein RGP1-like [Iris pallida]
MGHGRAGAVPLRHHGLLPGRARGARRVRRHQARQLRARPALARPAPGVRGPERGDRARRQQVRSRADEGGRGGVREGAGGEGGVAVPGDVGSGRDECGERVLDGAGEGISVGQPEVARSGRAAAAGAQVFAEGHKAGCCGEPADVSLLHGVSYSCTAAH